MSTQENRNKHKHLQSNGQCPSEDRLTSFNSSDRFQMERLHPPNGGLISTERPCCQLVRMGKGSILDEAIDRGKKISVFSKLTKQNALNTF